MKFIFSFGAMIIFLFTSCKKENDIVSNHTIKGMVYNTCTDSGLAGVQVFLDINNGSSTSEQQTTSDANGKFMFSAIQIHSSSKFTYALFIQTKSGGISSNPALTEIPIVGTTLNFFFNEVDSFFRPRVKPEFLLLQLYCNTSKTTFADSMKFTCVNYKVHKNRPDDIYFWNGGGYGDYKIVINPSPLLISYGENVPDYPMGKYNINMDIWKSGVHSTRKDSLYMGWGAQQTYTINW